MLKRLSKLFILVALLLSFQPKVDAAIEPKHLGLAAVAVAGIGALSYGLKKLFSSSESEPNPEQVDPEDEEDNQLEQGSAINDNDESEFGDDTRTEGEKIPLNEVADSDVQNLPDLMKDDFVKQVEPSDIGKQNNYVEQIPQDCDKKLGLEQYSEALQARLKNLGVKPR